MRALIVLLVFSLAGCSGGSKNAVTAITTPSPAPTNTTDPVIAIDKSTASSFGDVVTITLSDSSTAVQSITAGGTALSFSQNGAAVQITIPPNQPSGPLPIVVTDSNGETIAWNSGVGVSIQNGFSISTTEIANGMSFDDEGQSTYCFGSPYGVTSAGQIVCRAPGVPFSGINLIDPATGSATALSLTAPSGASIADITNVSIDGSYLYLNYQWSTNKHQLVRVNLPSGATDSSFSFSPITSTFTAGTVDIGFIANDGTNVYFSYTGADQEHLVISRTDESGNLDASFNGTGSVSLSCSGLQGTTLCSLGWYYKARLRELNGMLLFELAWVPESENFVQYLLALNSDGTAVSTAPAFLTQEVKNYNSASPASLVLDPAESPTTQILPGDGYSIFNIFVMNNQIYQVGGGEGGSIKRLNSDLSFDTNYYSDAPTNASSSNILSNLSIANRNYHTALDYRLAPNQDVGILELPLNSDYMSDFVPYELDVVDVTPLPSGNSLVLYITTQGSQADPGYNPQACFMILSSDGTPIYGNRAQHFCQSITAQEVYDSDAGRDIGLAYQLLKNSNGETYSVQGSTYTYTIVTDHVWQVSVQVNEGDLDGEVVDTNN